MSKRKTMRDFMSSDYSAQLIIKNLPFVLFLSFLATIYIANVHYAEKKMRTIKELQADIQKLNWEYMTLKSDLMYNSKQSEVAKMAAPLGLHLLKHQPYKIVIPKDGYQE